MFEPFSTLDIIHFEVWGKQARGCIREYVWAISALTFEVWGSMRGNKGVCVMG